VARLIMVTLVLALTSALVVGCSGGDDRAKVEASLQHYLDNSAPEDTALPLGVGAPQVRDNGCKDLHVKTEPGQVLSSRNLAVRMRKGVALWSCVVRVGGLTPLALPVLVAVGDSTEVAWEAPGEFKEFELK
jgi:hypothetical protein